jgi:hypothetical protein
VLDSDSVQIRPQQEVGVLRINAAVAPGDYKAELRITDKLQNQTATREVPFTVVN